MDFLILEELLDLVGRDLLEGAELPLWSSLPLIQDHMLHSFVEVSVATIEIALYNILFHINYLSVSHCHPSFQYIKYQS